MSVYNSLWAAATGLSPLMLVPACMIAAGVGVWTYLQVLRVFPRLNLLTLLGGVALVLHPAAISLYEALVSNSEHSATTALGIMMVGVGAVGSFVARRQSRQDRKLRKIWDRFYDRDVAMNSGR